MADASTNTVAAEPVVLSPAGAERPAGRVRQRGLPGTLWLVTVFFWKWWVGALSCLNPLGSVLVVGWTYRLVQRSVLKRWWMQCEMRHAGATFDQFQETDERLRQHVHWPNWIVQQQVLRGLRGDVGQAAAQSGRVRRLLKAVGHSLWLNLKIGIQGIFNTWVLTLPGCVLWLFAWYDGWNNSFNKGYEQAPVGPLTGLLGVALFIVAMLYVPMAQVRQAATGDWRAFYQFRFVRKLIRHRWLACLGLAVLYSLVSLPVTIMRALPAFFDQIMPDSANWTNAQAIQFLHQYFFWCCVFVFPAFVMLRLVAARVYAGAMLAAVESGAAGPYLGAEERENLFRLGLLHQRPVSRRPLLVRAVGWGSGRLARMAGFVAALLVWFSFVAQIFISEFFNYHPVIGWLNQPLVQLPFFHYVPFHLN